MFHVKTTKGRTFSHENAFLPLLFSRVCVPFYYTTRRQEKRKLLFVLEVPNVLFYAMKIRHM